MEYPHLERLTGAECRGLLAGAPVGRLAVPTPTFPTFDPVSFAVVEGELVVAVPAGSAGDALPEGAPVTFEADVVDPARKAGWSVVVKGPVEDLDDDVASLVAPRLLPWATAAGDRLLLIRSEVVTGQRVVSGPATETGTEPAGTARPAPAGAGASGPVVGIARRSVGVAEAQSLLREGGENVGRLVLTAGGAPDVYPLNFVVDGEAVVFRTGMGSKLIGITRSLATFEVDHIDPAGQGWSVTFEGLAQEILDSDPAELRARAAALPLEPWPGGDRPHLVRITPYSVRGVRWTPAGVPARPGGGQTTAG